MMLQKVLSVDGRVIVENTPETTEALSLLSDIVACNRWVVDLNEQIVRLLAMTPLVASTLDPSQNDPSSPAN